MGTPREAAERVTLERGKLKYCHQKGQEKMCWEEELTRVMKAREQKQVLARHSETGVPYNCGQVWKGIWKV